MGAIGAFVAPDATVMVRNIKIVLILHKCVVYSFMLTFKAIQ